MSRKIQHPPTWYEIGNGLMWPTLNVLHHRVRDRPGSNLHYTTIPECAVIHLIHCLDTSINANIEGRHSVAITLVRSCIETLTLIDVGLQNPEYGDPILRDWEEDKKSHGEIRKALEKDVWPRYGSGLWSETWPEFFGELAKAVQPYAHYTQLLQGWQFAVPGEQSLRQTADGNYQFIAALGIKTYDSTKATRITLLHCLIVWTAGRLLVANGAPDEINQETLRTFGKEMSQSELLGGGQLSWHEEFWPHMFDNPLKKKA